MTSLASLPREAAFEVSSGPTVSESAEDEAVSGLRTPIFGVMAV